MSTDASSSGTQRFIELVRKSALIDPQRLDAFLQQLGAGTPAGSCPPDSQQLAGMMVRDGLLTHFQAEQLLQGKWRRFTIGPYKVLERLGAGRMGSVYLCKYEPMRRRVAVKVLPAAKADDPAWTQRFLREAQAMAVLAHPNIVTVHQIGQEEKLYFLVMEYVDGSTLRDIVHKVGPLDVLRACHYIRQAAQGLQHAHERGLIHRDIEPSNIMVARSGEVKIIDLGLVGLSQGCTFPRDYILDGLFDVDYVPPEGGLGTPIDIRADIYSLGAVFYFLLTARPPFEEGTVAQKLLWHQTRQPRPIQSIRPEVPEEVVRIVDRMMARNPEQRYQTPQGVADGLAVWALTPIQPPPEQEMPHLCPAAQGLE